MWIVIKLIMFMCEMNFTVDGSSLKSGSGKPNEPLDSKYPK